jgi:hypothetical protein
LISGRLPFVNRPNGIPFPAITFLKSWPFSLRAAWARRHA